MSTTSPSRNSVPTTGTSVMIPGDALSALGTVVSLCGEPKRAVPRVTTSDEIVRISAGTRTADAAGGAVRAAISAGDRIREAATHPPTDDRTTATITIIATLRRLITTPCSAGDLGRVDGPGGSVSTAT
jgi:hypothetical protein